MLLILFYHLKWLCSAWGEIYNQTFTQDHFVEVSAAKNRSVSSLPHLHLLLHTCDRAAPPACAVHAAVQ